MRKMNHSHHNQMVKMRLKKMLLNFLKAKSSRLDYLLILTPSLNLKRYIRQAFQIRDQVVLSVHKYKPQQWMKVITESSPKNSCKPVFRVNTSHDSYLKIGS